ncbi:MAG: 2-C-methyl-D-erythritol 4-phosphate cytidylyltransferase [Bacteroidales bacterium]|nr:2-C-methyl-D-erythritol 4-phosphate cytidylyltransferase [Bacteroidales bacterium]MBO4566360.1 2-C-methyl-D-erythritol 4-phosphate cytidylyltransferase [Bacteroidales bacterium]
MTRPVYAVFVAGGSGTRMGGDVPKQFLELGGVPVLQRSIERFLDAEPQAHVVTVLPSQHIATWQELCVRYAASFPQTVVAGGMTRFHSVLAALAKVPDGAIVAVHDGVRPLVSPALVRRMLDEISAPGGPQALIPVLPVTDTLRSVDPSAPAPDRSKLVAVQTPQMFLSEVLKQAYRQPYSTSFTDDASVAEKSGVAIATTPGEKFNIKITTPEDLQLARLLLARP